MIYVFFYSWIRLWSKQTFRFTIWNKPVFIQKIEYIRALLLFEAKLFWNKDVIFKIYLDLNERNNNKWNNSFKIISILTGFCNLKPPFYTLQSLYS